MTSCASIALTLSNERASIVARSTGEPCWQSVAGQAGKDECVVCGKQIRKHRKVTGEGRGGSGACAHFWVENMS